MVTTGADDKASIVLLYGGGQGDVTEDQSMVAKNVELT